MMLKIDARIRRGQSLLDFRAEADATAVGVVGASGAGKTTLLHLLAGLIEPDDGVIEILGQTVFDSSTGVNVPAYKRRIGCVFQNARLFPHLTVEKNIRFGERGQSGTDQPLDFKQTVAMLELESLLHKRATQISGGEQQRVALARALMSSPGLLLLDEPLSSLDQERRARLIPFLGNLHNELNLPMLHVSHNLHEVLQLTDQLLVIHNNEVAGVGRFMDLVHERVLLHAPFTKSLCNVLPMHLRQNRKDIGNCLLETISSETMFLNGPLTNISNDTAVRVLFNADDVALALEPVAGVSIRNQFPAILTRHVERDGTVYCELEVGNALPVLVEISVGAFNELKIGELDGRPVFCLLKVGAMRIEPQASGVLH